MAIFDSFLPSLPPPQNPIVNDPSGAGNINIPTDVYGWSGLPKQYRESILSKLTPQLLSSVQNYPQNVEQAYSGATSILDQFQPTMERTMRGARHAIEAPMQSILNRLSSRGMLQSSVAGDALKGLGKELGRDMFDRIAQAEAGLLGTRAGLEMEKGQQLLKEPSLLANILGLGQTSEQPFQPYQAFLNLIQSQM